MYYSISEAIVRPEFNPLDPDIKMKDFLRSEELTKDYKDSILRITDDYTRRRSLNFTNVRKTPGQNKKKSHFYDVENLAFTYSYTQLYKRDVNTEIDKLETYRGAINYSFSGKAKNIEPFKNSEFLKKRSYLKLIKDINFNPSINQISIQNGFDRSYHERQARNISNFGNSAFVF